MINQNKANILAIFQLATPQERAEGMRWYSIAQSIAQDIAVRYGLPEATVTAVLTALSPRNRWERNVADCEAICNAFVNGGSAQALEHKACTFKSNKLKAIAALEDNLSTDAAALALLKGPKVSEFYRCIRGESDVCIDGHAWCIHANERRGLAEVPKITPKMRQAIKSDYLAAAEAVGVTGYQMQAITWLAWRRIHGVTK